MSDSALATSGQEERAFSSIAESIAALDHAAVRSLAETLVEAAATSDAQRAVALDLLTRLRDRHYDPGGKTRASLLGIWDQSIRTVFRRIEPLSAPVSGAWRRIDFPSRAELRSPRAAEKYLVIDARDFLN